jgi:predicted aminopeptidase
MMDELNAVYDDVELTRDEKIARREEVFTRALQRFDDRVAPHFESVSFGGFRDTPLNNATLLARIRYFHRLPDFQALLNAHEGYLDAVLAELRSGVAGVTDPFDLLPSGGIAP